MNQCYAVFRHNSWTSMGEVILNTVNVAHIYEHVEVYQYI